MAGAGLFVWVVKLLLVRHGVGRASRPERGYVGLLARRLREHTGNDVQVINLSRSGAPLGDLLSDQLPRVQALQPDLVTVGIGGNDLLAYDPATYAEQVETLTRAPPRGAVVADAPCFMQGYWEHDATRAAELMARSAGPHGLVVVPLHDALRREGWSAMATQFTADFFHPDDRGHRVWADAFGAGVAAAPVAQTSHRARHEPVA